MFDECAIIFISFCATFVIFLWYTKRTRTAKDQEDFDANLLVKRMEEYEPEPLIHGSDGNFAEMPALPKNDPNAIDLAKTDYLGMLNDGVLEKAAESSIMEYGVGTCGPRGFYGTTDVHLQLEQYLANFLQVEESIIYAYGFTTISSAIATFCKPYDLIYTDENVNFAIKQGIKACKSQVFYFSHNDYKELERAAMDVNSDRKRKFLIIEGIYFKTGTICPLPQFLKVAERCKMRIFLDETISLGVLGETGRGITEHFEIDPKDIDMIMGTLEGALGSVGGFCAGSSAIIEHQRLSSAGYIFSASLPTYLCQAALIALREIYDKPIELKRLSNYFHDGLNGIGTFEICSDCDVPIKIFFVRDGNVRENNRIVQKHCRENDVHFINRGNTLVINLNVTLIYQNEKLEKCLNVLTNATKYIKI